jgi:hypothetical protein
MAKRNTWESLALKSGLNKAVGIAAGILGFMD